MSSEDSQSPDAPGPERLFAQCLQIIPGLVRNACLHYRYSPSQDEVDELADHILFLLFDDDYSLLRSFGGRSSLKTWLFPVVTHHVEHYLRERKRWTVLEDAPPSLLVSQPIQEEQAASHERRKRFKAALSNLTEGERKLVWLICKEPDEQKIAKRLGATVGAIYQRKHRLIKKIQRLLGK